MPDAFRPDSPAHDMWPVFNCPDSLSGGMPHPHHSVVQCPVDTAAVSEAAFETTGVSIALVIA